MGKIFFVIRFNFLKSQQNLVGPSGLRIKTIGKAHGDLDFSIILAFNISSTASSTRCLSKTARKFGDRHPRKKKSPKSTSKKTSSKKKPIRMIEENDSEDDFLPMKTSSKKKSSRKRSQRKSTPKKKSSKKRTPKKRIFKKAYFTTA